MTFCTRVLGHTLSFIHRIYLSTFSHVCVGLQPLPMSRTHLTSSQKSFLRTMPRQPPTGCPIDQCRWRSRVFHKIIQCFDSIALHCTKCNLKQFLLIVFWKLALFQCCFCFDHFFWESTFDLDLSSYSQVVFRQLCAHAEFLGGRLIH